MGKAGRRKGICEIKDPKSKKTTLCKRKKGLFNKITELHETTGASAAAIVFSAAGGCWAHGSPNLDAVLDRFLDDVYGTTEMEDIRKLLATPTDECEDLNQLLKMKQQLEWARAKIQTQRKLMMCS